MLQAMQCKHCKAEFKPATYWQKFCSDACRLAFNADLTKRGRELARRERDQQQDEVAA
jgi:hypothetical protein